MQFEVSGLARKAVDAGWASGPGDLLAVQLTAGVLGWTEVPTRRGEQVLTTLTPSETEDAKPRSLSAIYGLAQLPLHTDGAHLERPPDFVVLIAEAPSATATRLWVAAPATSAFPMDDAQHGVFLVDGGRDKFYSTASSSDGHIRYDPGCMHPCDPRAIRTANYFENQEENATRLEWTGAGVLIIDNRRTLHGREAVTTSDVARVLRRIAYHAKDEQ
ncbi:TauD/TfdA family dioxygenase [Kribbella sp. CA-294648]|uniref:TauD/TfdA family dioxygenase n=1 Tax=Kribbella sp. CA-294648 TaxID=3239948 RepID=UPI003D8B88C3